jgi:hypothetical protein
MMVIPPSGLALSATSYLFGRSNHPYGFNQRRHHFFLRHPAHYASVHEYQPDSAPARQSYISILRLTGAVDFTTHHRDGHGHSNIAYRLAHGRHNSHHITASSAACGAGDYGGPE